MKKAEKKTLAAYRLITTGAACYRRPDGTHTCIPKFTKEQAEDFGPQHNLVLVKWEAGATCVGFCPDH